MSYKIFISNKVGSTFDMSHDESSYDKYEKMFWYDAFAII
jgi:hypothetical protein